MLENNANAHAHHYNRTREKERERERARKPIFNNIKRQVHDREGKRERELLSIAKKKKKTNEQTLEYKIWSEWVDSSLAKNNSHIWCTTYIFTASLTRWVALIYARCLYNNYVCMNECRETRQKWHRAAVTVTTYSTIRSLSLSFLFSFSSVYMFFLSLFFFI